MCVDNPREGFGELFDTHPTVDSRVAALVKFAGGHDPGPIALPPPASEVGEEPTDDPAAAGPWGSSAASGPRGSSAENGSGAPPPSRSHAEINSPSEPGRSGPSSGPWGPRTGG